MTEHSHPDSIILPNVEGKRLSIIIPMYKVEDFVERCIRSLEDQDIPSQEYEIICIEDGSPDDCSKIVKNLQKEFDNIVLSEQENQGVSLARNNGFAKAAGKYVVFIDPDDYVEPNRLADILSTTEHSNAEVSFLPFTVLREDGSVGSRIFRRQYESGIYSGIEAYALARGDGRTDPDRMWAILFEREFIIRNSLYFLPGVPYLEDGELIARTLCVADRCIFTGQSFYMRTTRPQSATNSDLYYSDKATNGFISAGKNLKKFQNETNLNGKQMQFLNQPIVKFVTLAVDSTGGRRSSQRYKRTVQALRSCGLSKVNIKGCNLEYWLCGFLYNISPWLGGLMLNLYTGVKRITHFSRL